MNSFRREDHGETFDFSKVLSHVVLSSINNVAYIISSPSSENESKISELLDGIPGTGTRMKGKG